MNALVKYDAACRAVAEAASIDEAKDLRDKGEAMRAYARQAKNKDLEVQAAEIRIRAERRIGELMAAQRETEGLNKGAATRVAEKPASPPTLAEVGIDKNLADRARKYAAIPEAEFNGIVGEWKERVEAENARVTVNLLAAGEKAAEPEPGPEDPATAKLRAEFRKLTREAQEDDWIGLRLADAENKARIRKQTHEIADLKVQIKNHTDDKDEVIRRLTKEAKDAKSAKFRAEEDLTAWKRQVHGLKKDVARLEKSLASQEITL
jgi:hypothetical protein